MGVREFCLPDLGEGLTEGTVVEWLVAVGERVVVDQPVAQVETAKAVVEVPCPFDGEVAVLHAAEGEEIAVGAPLLSVRDAVASDGDGSSVREASSRRGSSSRDGSASQDKASGNGHDPQAQDGDDGGLVDDFDGVEGASGNVLVGYGTSGATKRRRRGRPGLAAMPSGPRHGPSGDTGRPLAKPPVRKLAKDLGVDLWGVTPTGAGGVITRDDVRAAAQPAADAARTVAGRMVAEAADERVALVGVRKRIAERMSVSRREIPEATTWVDCDATELLRMRGELNARQDAVRVSPLAIVLRACVAGLRRFPDLNSSLDTDAGEIVRHGAIHLGVAAQTDRGLLVPVIRDAHERTLLELAAELVRLAEGARAGTLSPDELTGSTFTVTNYGSFGVDGGNPVINHPEAAILGVGRIADRPWVVDGALVARKVCQLSIAFDHRICDGGEAAGFLRHVADCVESSAVLLGDL